MLNLYHQIMHVVEGKDGLQRSPHSDVAMTSPSEETAMSVAMTRIVSHPVVGDIEVPLDMKAEEVERLLNLKQDSVRSAIRRQVDYYFR